MHSLASARIVKKDLGGLDSSAKGTRFEAPSSSAEGARIEAPRGEGCGEGVFT